MSADDRLSMPLREAIYSLRAIRRVKPDPIPDQDLREIMEATIRAPNGGNQQPWHYIVVTDAELRRRLGELYHEAWWAKRRDQGIHGPEDIAPENRTLQSAMKLAEEISEAPVMVLVCATATGEQAMGSIIPSVQNMLLAARALGIGGTIATLHPQVVERVHQMFDIPDTAQVVYCIPLGYPRGNFGVNVRKPTTEVCSYNAWGAPVPWT